MADKVNGGAQAGEFLTGNMDFFTIVTLVPMAQTNVTTPVDQLYVQQGYTTWQPVTVINGAGTAVTYSTQASYQDALVQQNNFTLLLQLFAQRVNPVMVSITGATVGNPAATTYTGYLNGTALGSNYSSSATVTTIKLATEKTGYWNVSTAAESNDLGYQLLASLNGIAVEDTAAGVIAPNTFNTQANGVGTGTTERNTLAIRALVL
jgi:hypothetical protein